MPSTHVIRSQILKVEVSGTESDGFDLQRRLPELCRDWLMPALERVLERSVPAYEHWTIDRLEVDAGTFSLENLEGDLIEVVTRAMESLLRQRAPPAGAIASASPIQRRTHARSVQEAFLHFLTTGSLPWWFHVPAGTTLEDIVQASWQAAAGTVGPPEPFARSTIDVIAPAAVRQRLVRQFSADFLRALLARLSPDVEGATREILAKLGDPDLASPPLRRFSEQLWQTAFDAAAAGRRPTAAALVDECSSLLRGVERQDPALREQIARLWPEVLSRQSAAKTLFDGTTNIETRRPDDGMTQSIARVDLQEGVFIRCAGLVLLHPFLPQLFEALGIAAHDRMLQPERALCLLHFLATGQRVAPEYELLLPKLLCGVPFEQPVDARIELLAAAEAEALALLDAVMRHWGALGDTSADGLRGTFLTRPGKLSRRDDGGDVLQVEARSFDILLDRLPWAIGMIKLPWMERILRVEWG
jgi:hypothetical protein